MLAELFVPVHWLLDRDLHERRLRDVWEMKMSKAKADAQPNPVQLAVHNAFMVSAAALVNQAWSDGQVVANQPAVIAKFKTDLAALRTLQTALEGAAA